MRNRFTDELAVCGFNAIRALSEVHPENINRLFLREDRLPSFTRLCKNLAERKRPYKLCENEELEKICKTPHHQGIVAMIYEPVIEGAEPEDIDAWAEEGKTGLLLCDIGNDHNLGAIIRSAAFFDASPVILTERAVLPKREGPPRGVPEPALPAGQKDPAEPSPALPPEAETLAGAGEGEAKTKSEQAAEEKENSRQLTTSAYRTAEGGMEYVEFRSVRNPVSFLRSASKKLISIGTDPRARIRIRDLPKIIDGIKKERRVPAESSGRPGVVLVIGNEETGLSPAVKEQCSILVRIPGTGAIESLNAAQAATLFLQELYER